MKCVIAFSCLLAVASAGYINAPIAYAGYGDGAYRGEGLYESAYKGEGILESQGYGYAAPLAVAAPGLPLASEARLIDPVAIAAGAPLPTGDTVEVAAAKAAHLQAHSVAKGLAYGAPIAHSVAHAYAAPIAHAYAAPIAHAYAAPIAHAYAAPGLGLASEARLIDPVAIAAGAPLPTGDTVEVAAAKAFHHQAHAVAKGLAYGAPVAPIAHSVAHAYAGPIAHAYAAPGVALASEARLIDPVAIAAGAPLPTGDNIDVAAAKAFHHQAHLNAKATHFAAKGHYIAKRSPGYLGAAAYAAPIHSYGYSSYAAPLAYSTYNNYGYGLHRGLYL